MKIKFAEVISTFGSLLSIGLGMADYEKAFTDPKVQYQEDSNTVCVTCSRNNYILIL